MQTEHIFEIGELVYWDPAGPGVMTNLTEEVHKRGVGVVVKQWEPTFLREDLRIPHYEIYWTKTGKTLPECEARLTCAVRGRYSQA